MHCSVQHFLFLFFFAKAILQLSGNVQYFRGRKASGAVTRSAFINANKPLVQVHNEPLRPRSKPVFSWNRLCNPSNDDAAGDWLRFAGRRGCEKKNMCKQSTVRGGVFT